MERTFNYIGMNLATLDTNFHGAIDEFILIDSEADEETRSCL